MPTTGSIYYTPPPSTPRATSSSCIVSLFLHLTVLAVRFMRSCFVLWHNPALSVHPIRRSIKHTRIFLTCPVSISATHRHMKWTNLFRRAVYFSLGYTVHRSTYAPSWSKTTSTKFIDATDLLACRCWKQEHIPAPLPKENGQKVKQLMYALRFVKASLTNLFCVTECLSIELSSDISRDNHARKSHFSFSFNSLIQWTVGLV